jgi:hypothetical protein
MPPQGHKSFSDLVSCGPTKNPCWLLLHFCSLALWIKGALLVAFACKLHVFSRPFLQSSGGPSDDLCSSFILLLVVLVPAGFQNECTSHQCRIAESHSGWWPGAAQISGYNPEKSARQEGGAIIPCAVNQAAARLVMNLVWFHGDFRACLVTVCPCSVPESELPIRLWLLQCSCRNTVAAFVF